MRDHDVEADGLVLGHHRAQRAVGGPPDRGLRLLGRLARGQPTRPRIAPLDPVRIERDRPHAVEEAAHSADPAGIPGPALLPRPNEHQEEAQRVGPIAMHDRVGRLDVAAGLAHALARRPGEDLPLVVQSEGRLPVPDQPEVGHHLREEAEVEQMEHRVLRAARVVVDRRPARDGLPVDGRAVEVR